MSVYLRLFVQQSVYIIISLVRLLFLAVHPGADVGARIYVFHPQHGVDVGPLHAAELLPRFVFVKFTPDNCAFHCS